MCRKRKIRDRMRETPWAILACSVQHILRCHTVCHIRCNGSDDDAFCRPLRSAWRHQVLRPAAAILPQPAFGCFGTPWRSQHPDDDVVPIGELLQETAARWLLQKPHEWPSSVWCFESPYCPMQSPLCRLAPPLEAEPGVKSRLEMGRYRMRSSRCYDNDIPLSL